MLTMTDPLRSKNLVPFKKRRGAYHIFGTTAEDEELSLDQVDQDLDREEQRFIRHYLGYADTLLKNAPVEAPESIAISESPVTMDDKSSGEKLPEDNGSPKAA